MRGEREKTVRREMPDERGIEESNQSAVMDRSKFTQAADGACLWVSA